jgi:hypothetical protein
MQAQLIIMRKNATQNGSQTKAVFVSAVTDSLNLMHGIIIRKTFFRLISTVCWNSRWFWLA